MALTGCSGAGPGSDEAASGGSEGGSGQDVTVVIELDATALYDVPDITGREVLDQAITWKYCPRSPEWSDNTVDPAKRLKIRVVNENDDVLGTTFSDPVNTDPDWKDNALHKLKCEISVTIPDVPSDEEFYTFQADINESNFGSGPDTAQVTLSRADLEASDWVADLIIRTTF